MKASIKITALALLWSFSALSQQSNKNFVTTRTARAEGYTSLIGETDINVVNISTQYFDGLGRPTQQVMRKASPDGRDILQLVGYDQFGRQNLSYLPFVHSYQNTGEYLDASAFITGQSSFYETKTGSSADGDNAYSKVVFESSPLNRKVKTMAPGAAWVGSIRGVSVRNLTNTSGDAVIHWIIADEGFTAAQEPYFSAGELYKTETTDEQGNTTIEYTDKQGRTLLKESESGDALNPWYRTYYIYDDLNRLRYVLPPVASFQCGDLGAGTSGTDAYGGTWMYVDTDLTITNATLAGKTFPLTIWAGDGVNITLSDPFSFDAFTRGKLTIRYGHPPNSPEAVLNMTFQYQYDHRGRMTAKKVPDADWVYMVYDQWDRLVLTQDGNQRKEDKWMFTAYDILNRPIITGLVIDTRSHAALQTYVMGLGGRYHTRNTTKPHGYNALSFPFNAAEAIYSVTYYDDYGFVTGSDWAGFGFTEDLDLVNDDMNPAVKGQVTGSKQLILGTTDTYLHSVNYYDRKYQLIQSRFHNPQQEVITQTNAYNFVGNLTASKTVYQGLFDQAVYRWYSYDHMNRLLNTQMRIGAEGEPVVTIQENQYNGIGELIEKNIYASDDQLLQSTDYQYNIRGWLTRMNTPDLSADGTNDYGVADVFGMELLYDAAGLYNGNIGRINWSNLTSGSVNNYAYAYDPMNRLTSADYGQSGIFSNTKFDVSGITYDANGNIRSLDRRGEKNMVGDDMDLLTYQYAPNSNQLRSVQDAGDQAEGFRDGANHGSEYAYDANGNMLRDANKGITHIVYNHLNLPERVEMATATVEYDYLADGTKIANRVTREGETTTRQYQNGLVFENGALDHLLTEEGKVVPLIPGSDQLTDFQYFLKDHLGNVRSVVRNARIYEYLATMEDDVAQQEEVQFTNIAETRHQDVAFAHTGEHFAITDNNQPVGPAFALKVHKGDTVSLSVFGRVSSGGGGSGGGGTEAIAAALLSALTTQSIHLGESATTLSNALATALGGLGAGASSNANATGYLNYLLFDQAFNFVTGGFSAVTENGYLEKAIPDIAVSTPGYMITYLSYESTAPDQVFFDDFSIDLKTSGVIQTDDYYPFGLRFNSYTSGTPNKYLFQGQEHQDETGWDQFKWRNSMPELGRFFNVDPLAEDYYYNSPYAFSENKVVAHIELEGLEAVSIQAEGRGIVPVAGNLSVTASGAYGLAVGTRRGQDGIHAVQYVSGSLGPASGIGLAGGIGTYVNSGDLEDLSGLGFGAGGFLGPTPTGLAGGSFELNTTGDGTQLGGLLPFASPGGAVGGGVWAEASYTEFLGEPINLTNMSEEAMGQLAESLGIAVEQLTEFVNGATEYINNQQSQEQLPSLEEMKEQLDQGYIVPSDATSNY